MKKVVKSLAQEELMFYLSTKLYDLIEMQDKRLEYFPKNAAESREKTFQHFQVGKALKIESSYFYVGLFGGFPPQIRNRAFVWRNEDSLERLQEFIERMKENVGADEVLNHSNPPSEEILNSHNKYVQIFRLEPCLKEHVIKGKTCALDPGISSVFLFNKPIKGEKEEKVEWKVMNIERRYYKTSLALPSPSPCHLIFSISKVRVNGAEILLNSLEQKTAQLERHIKKYSSIQSLKTGIKISRMTQILQGVLYNRGFAVPEVVEISSKMLKETEFNLLKVQLARLSELVEQAMGIHSKFVSETMRPLHVMFEAQFISFKQEILIYCK